MLAARDYMAVYDRAAEVAALKPDFAAPARLDRALVIATSQGEGDVDFVSRCFAPAHGINEDPVTGSAHRALPTDREAWPQDDSPTRQSAARHRDYSCKFKG